MIPRAATYFSEKELELFHQIELLVQEVELPDLGLMGGARPLGANPDMRYLVSCHMVTRAIAALYPQLAVKDGTFMRGYGHSWLVDGRGHIIDPYPWAMVGGPIMLSTEDMSPWNNKRQWSIKHEVYGVYEEDEPDEGFNREPFLTHAAMVTDAFCIAAKKFCPT